MQEQNHKLRHWSILTITLRYCLFLCLLPRPADLTTECCSHQAEEVHLDCFTILFATQQLQTMKYALHRQVAIYIRGGVLHTDSTVLAMRSPFVPHASWSSATTTAVFEVLLLFSTCSTKIFSKVSATSALASLSVAQVTGK